MGRSRRLYEILNQVWQTAQDTDSCHGEMCQIQFTRKSKMSAAIFYWCLIVILAISNTVAEILRPKLQKSPFYPYQSHLTRLMGTLKPQSNSNTLIGTLTVDGWAVTFGTARRGLGGQRPRPVPSSLYQL